MIRFVRDVRVWQAVSIVLLLLLLARECAPTIAPISETTPTVIALATNPPYPAGFTPQPTSTPAPSTLTPTITRVPTSTPTPVPIIGALIESATVGHVPLLQKDFFFGTSTSLLRWNHLTQHVERINVGTGSGEVHYSLSADGRMVAYNQHTPSEAIMLLGVPTQQLTTLAPLSSVQGLVAFGDMAFSPDGQWLAYVLLGSRPSTSRATGLTAPAVGGVARSGMIYAVRTDAPDRRIEVGYCASTGVEYARGCMGFLWALDSRTVAWKDGRGVWVTELGKTARQLTNDEIVMPNEMPRGVWNLVAWSPQGRYLLGRVAYYEGSGWGVLDTQTARAMSVPDSFEYPRPNARITWMRDGRLVATKDRRLEKFVEVWRVRGDGDNLLVRETQVQLNVSHINFPTAPTQLPNGQIGFALLNASASEHAERGLYTLNLKDNIVRKVAALPPARGLKDALNPDLLEEANVFWSSDGTGAIFTGFDTIVTEVVKGCSNCDGSKATPTVRQSVVVRSLYVPFNGEALFDLTPILGSDVCCFTWLR